MSLLQPEGLLFLLAFVAYGVAIARPMKVQCCHRFFNLVAPRKMEAHLVPFIIWLTADVIVLVGMLKEETDNAQIWAAVIGASCIVTLGLFHRKPGWDWTDKISLALSGTGLVLWRTLDSPRWAILFGLAAIFVAGLPIYKETWGDPSKWRTGRWKRRVSRSSSLQSTSPLSFSSSACRFSGVW
ncbi:hypothetical protein L0Y40_00660 [Candidatus Wolfebacteria bacterium]|nr:hypothetical protein [Candidatus Wolfebacteria bacterium]